MYKSPIKIIMSVPERREYLEYLTKLLPSAIVRMDKDRDSMPTFLSALKIAGKKSVLLIEDDAIPTSNFEQKITLVIEKHYDKVTQFFSRRKKDIEIGSRYEYGGNFLATLCFYLPEGYAASILAYYKKWIMQYPHGRKHKEYATDYLVASFLKKRKEKYYLHVPSLVEHRQIVSAIDKRRSKYRQSLTFEP